MTFIYRKSRRTGGLVTHSQPLGREGGKMDMGSRKSGGGEI